jgi:hypothetical protein
MAVFPYQTMFGIASRRSVAGGVMQSYLASGEYLSRVDIAGLERAAAPAGLYLPARELSVPVDGVSNFIRSSEVWLWMFHHYHSEQQFLPGIFGLRKDDSRAARIAMHPRLLDIAARSYPIPKRHSTADLGDPAWPGEGADFLRLRLKVHYGFWLKLRKPERLQLEITLADGTLNVQSFVVEPNVSSEIWFYPWNDADLAQYFDPDETRWRVGTRPAITRLRLLVMPLDWVSVQPDMIEVQSVEAIRFDMAR